MIPQSSMLWQSSVQLSPHEAVQSLTSWHSTEQSFSQMVPQLVRPWQAMSQPSPEHSKKQKL